jgi:hypothetical protein
MPKLVRPSTGIKTTVSMHFVPCRLSGSNYAFKYGGRFSAKSSTDTLHAWKPDCKIGSKKWHSSF